MSRPGRAAKWRRRFLAWERYEHRCEMLLTSPVARWGFHVHQHAGHAKAYALAGEIGRYPPIGIRYVRLLPFPRERTNRARERRGWRRHVVD